ncbi:MAG: FHA domain-containing protein [Woeseiaceae bacterium]|nr:FHA domain-containing protein [Woeseiaceae bacterium]
MEKNNNRNLVSGVDDDPTTELEIVAHSLQPLDSDGELESDANTFNFDDENADREVTADSIASLELGIRERDQSIARLEFDIEQLRSRWNALDKEIKVREKLTDNVNAELRKAKNELAATQKNLRDSQAHVELLATAIADSARSAEENTALIESLRAAAEFRQSQVANLELQQVRNEQESGELRNSLEAIRVESAVQAQELAAGKIKLHDTTAKLQDAERRINELCEQLAGRDCTITEQSAELETVRRQVAESNEDLSKLRQIGADGGTAAHVARAAGPEAGDEQQSGAFADSRQEIRELQAQLSRTEGYADALRIKLQQQNRAADEATRARKATEIVLADARQQIVELRQQLDGEKQSSADLRDRLDEMHAEFEAEVSRIGFELGTAQQIIADHESIHEQLTADLFDSQSFRQVLESQLERTQESSEALLKSLRQKIKRLEHQHEDDRHKLSNKDGAIAALLNELANRSSTVRTAVETDNSISPELQVEPDVRQDDRSAADRITRLLIGNVDGQELRFPLFKDRLTIGRTRNNDIHLKAQYISRRHALIVTENDRTRIVDWGSKNGIAVNQQPVTEQVLRSGDIVTIGNADFRYEERPKR